MMSKKKIKNTQKSKKMFKRYLKNAFACPLFFKKKKNDLIWCRSDLQGIKCYAKKDGSDYILNGSKVYISNGWLADVVVVVAVTNREAKSAAHGISLFLLQDKTPGFHKSWLMKKIGLRAFVCLLFPPNFLY